jgi:hypothetical protein
MRYSNLSNNMMISKLWTTITVQIQYVDGRAAHTTDTILHPSWQSSPLPDHAGFIPVLFTWRWISFGGVKTCFFVNFQVKIQIFRWLFKCRRSSATPCVLHASLALSSAEALVFLGFNITMRYISLHFTWRIWEHERSRWAKERRRKRKKAREGAKPLCLCTICINLVPRVFALGKQRPWWTLVTWSAKI